MFPVSYLALTSIALSSTFLCGAFARRRRRRLALYLLATVITAIAIMLLIDLRNEYAGIGLLILSGLSVVSVALGEGWQRLVRLFLRNNRLFLLLLIAPAILFSGWFLARQYVPQTCLSARLPVTVGTEEVHVQISDAPMIRWAPDGEDETWLFLARGVERKEKVAQTCRLSRNGTRPFPASRVYLGAKRVSGTDCRGGVCLPLRQPAEFVLETTNTSNPEAPSYWFESDAQELVFLEGNTSRGALCTLPDLRPNTLHCMRWTMLAPGVRAIVSSDEPPSTAPEVLADRLENELQQWQNRIAK